MSIITTHTTDHRSDVVLDGVRHGLVDAAGECRDLEAVLSVARAADRDGASCVVVPAVDAEAPAVAHHAVAAQALAVLLATTRVSVAVEVHAPAWGADAVARFAGTAATLSGHRLVVRVSGPGAAAFAERVGCRWDGTLVVMAQRRAAPRPDLTEPAEATEISSAGAGRSRGPMA